MICRLFTIPDDVMPIVTSAGLPRSHKPGVSGAIRRRPVVITKLIRCSRIQYEMRREPNGDQWLCSEEHHERLLNAWVVRFQSGFKGFLSYRFGELSLEIDLSTGNGGRRTFAIVRYRPNFVGSVCSQLALGANPAMSLVLERARVADDLAELRELRLLNRQNSWYLGENQVLGWLEMRNRYFDLLFRHGWAGGRFPVVVAEKDGKGANTKWDRAP